MESWLDGIPFLWFSLRQSESRTPFWQLLLSSFSHAAIIVPVKASLLVEVLPEIGNVNLRKTLKRMAADGQIKKSAREEYCAFSASSPSPEQEGLSPSGTLVTSVTSVPIDQTEDE